MIRSNTTFSVSKLRYGKTVVATEKTGWPFRFGYRSQVIMINFWRKGYQPHFFHFFWFSFLYDASVRRFCWLLGLCWWYDIYFGFSAGQFFLRCFYTRFHNTIVLDNIFDNS